MHKNHPDVGQQVWVMFTSTIGTERNHLGDFVCGMIAGVENVYNIGNGAKNMQRVAFLWKETLCLGERSMKKCLIGFRQKG